MNEITQQEIEAKHLALVYELSRSVFIYVVNGGIIYPLAMAILIVTMPGSDSLLLDSPFTNWVDLAWWIPVIGGSGSLIIFLPRLPGAIADMRKAAHALDERRLPRPPFFKRTIPSPHTRESLKLGMLALSLGLAGIFFDNGLGIVLKLAGIVGIIAVGLRVVTDSGHERTFRFLSESCRSNSPNLAKVNRMGL